MIVFHFSNKKVVHKSKQRHLAISPGAILDLPIALQGRCYTPLPLSRDSRCSKHVQIPPPLLKTDEFCLDSKKTATLCIIYSAGEVS